jgi:glycosyl transferase, family 25
MNKIKTFTKFLMFIALSVLFLSPQYYVLEDSNKKIVENNPSNNIYKNIVTSYIINLDRSKERYEYVKTNIYNLGYPVDRISAVDGRLLNSEELQNLANIHIYKTFLHKLPEPGTIGCSLSHIKTWESFLLSDSEYALIFEDDVEFDPKLLRETVEELVKNNKLWDIASFELSHRGMPLTIKELTHNQKIVIYLAEVSHAGSYIINRKAAKNLLQKSLPIIMPVDHYFTRSWEFNLKFVGIEPRIVKQTFPESEIGKTKTIDKIDLGFLDYINRAVYKFQSYIIRAGYNLKQYISDREQSSNLN